MTPAQKEGIVAGKRYIVVGPQGGAACVETSGGVEIGDTVVLNEDDTTALPFFDKVDSNGKVLLDRVVINLNRTKLAPLDQESKQLVDYSVSINTNSTTIVIQKRLSLDEVNAVLKAAGV